MKNVCFTLWICFISLTLTQAQTEKGRWFVGTQIGNFVYQDQNNIKTFSGSITPAAGYFVANGLVVGAGVPLSLSTSTYVNPSFANLRYVSTSIGLTPFIRYYFGAAKWKPFVGLAGTYSGTTIMYKVDINGGETKAKGHTTAYTPTFGVAYFINRGLAVTGSLNYNVSHQESKIVSTSSYTPAVSSGDSDNRNLSLSLGFQIFIGK